MQIGDYFPLMWRVGGFRPSDRGVPRWRFRVLGGYVNVLDVVRVDIIGKYLPDSLSYGWENPKMKGLFSFRAPY